MGDMPLMTSNGTFVINGTERVIVSQMHRSPGVFFDHDRGRTHASGKLLFAARIIPYRGSWLDFEFDAKDVVYVRIDRRRKLPVTTLLYALGLNDEEILRVFYKHILIKESKRGWKMPFVPEKMRGMTPIADLADAKTGEVVARAGEKITARKARELSEEGLKEVLVPPTTSRVATSRRTSSISTPALSMPRPATSSTRSCWPSSKSARSRSSRFSTSTTSTSGPSSATRSTSTRTPIRKRR